ncbi:RNA 2'-phosphotransferase [Rubinisphaera sp.]|uniref:RNA 2'-phosphotransferase n=1 Tax=Rubinisphaera sp. TaxID=2024857 RepID=UPI000C11554F|nr:RNA 2'-phosphotransferase [Rubinisphaera sp.]MBV10406.1 RNA 2'-phosphotransferase [Rubinisphaera sp.]HCS52969.1 RNA 2'-phosphotransferase [Planctomycetaceae bacterium]|tara:strand:+ start:309 stop:848 length:540 start_codon:yes stop_codon:yes gene_type:complete
MDSIVHTSKFLSLVLRHKPETIGIVLDDSGWVKISELIEASRSSGQTLDHDLLLRVVHENDKQRFAISADGESIRANQGHSVKVDLGLTPQVPPEALYHGTVAKFLTSIQENGLIPGERQYVHLSADTQTAQIVGKRRGKPVILVIDAQKMMSDGMSFFLSNNGVWLTSHVPAKYIEFP